MISPDSCGIQLINYQKVLSALELNFSGVAILSFLGGILGFTSGMIELALNNSAHPGPGFPLYRPNANILFRYPLTSAILGLTGFDVGAAVLNIKKYNKRIKELIDQRMLSGLMIIRPQEQVTTLLFIDINEISRLFNFHIFDQSNKTIATFAVEIAALIMPEPVLYGQNGRM